MEEILQRSLITEPSGDNSYYIDIDDLYKWAKSVGFNVRKEKKQYIENQLNTNKKHITGYKKGILARSDHELRAELWTKTYLKTIGSSGVIHSVNTGKYGKLVLLKEAQKPNKTFSTIAHQLDCDRRTVSCAVARFNETGLLTERERPGRPHSLTDGQQRSLDKYISKHPTATSNQLSNYIFNKFDIRVSERTLQRYRRALGFYPRKQKTKVKSTQAQVEKRHLFAIEHQNSELKKWLFIDETQVQLRNTGKIIWVKRGEPTPTHEISSLRAYVNLWGAVWWNGKTFARYDGYVNQTLFQHLLASHLGPHVHKYRRYAVAQDKLRSHWAKPVRRWFNDHGLKLLDWPPHSPEFNAIENVWHSLKETVKTAHPKSQAELEAAVDQACHLISQKLIQGCISRVSTLPKEETSN
ncbi:unnamed protein product [Rotaria sp. Silwood2]|nr:unnamed protein product [Rotaria sp. Silwood2]CAF3277157.1 unnamed protein product [Rotaria sp. Silwood2]CAF3921665.1 unnamed protein product [Rotaria sp. Silwood2]CAF4095349.1 unnamed protein product [Rotaria sp. Silwood2]